LADIDALFPTPISPAPLSDQLCHIRTASNLININLLAVFTASVAILVKLDIVVHALMAVGVGLVDLGALGKLAVGLETSGLVSAVLEDDITLFVLIVPQREEDDVALIDPDFFAQFALWGG
jgi:hypothetical protein